MVRRVQSVPSEKWLSVREASALIGISPATLRRWSVAGNVQAFTTPGGHRRFARSEILMLLKAPIQQSVRPIRPTNTAPHLSRMYRRTMEQLSPREAWLNGFGEIAKGSLHEQGSRMSTSLMRFLDATDPQERLTAIRGAHMAASAFGRIAAQSSSEIRQTVQVFLISRMIFLSDLLEGSLASESNAFESTHRLVIATQTTDQLLISLMEAHESETVRAGMDS